MSELKNKMNFEETIAWIEKCTKQKNVTHLLCNKILSECVKNCKSVIQSLYHTEIGSKFIIKYSTILFYIDNYITDKIKKKSMSDEFTTSVFFNLLYRG